MGFGKSVRIYLKDGEVTGLKIGEVVNHTIQCISCPRIKATELAAMSEPRRPGVYFLFGKEEETNDDIVYIGEAENVWDRLQSHLTNKDFWNEMVFFISKDENLTKAHVKYLESRIIQQAHITDRYKIDNYNQPQLPSLPYADRDAMEEFLVQVKMLLGIMGFKLLEEVVERKPTPVKQPAIIPQQVQNLSKVAEPSETEFYLNVNDLAATAVQTNEGFVVLEGADASISEQPSLQDGYKNLRNKSIENGTLVMNGNKYRFTKDVLFSSLSAAACVVVGFSINGPQTWKDIYGRSFKTLEQIRMNSLTGSA